MNVGEETNPVVMRYHCPSDRYVIGQAISVRFFIGLYGTTSFRAITRLCVCLLLNFRRARLSTIHSPDCIGTSIDFVLLGCRIRLHMIRLAKLQPLKDKMVLRASIMAVSYTHLTLPTIA